MLLEDHLNQKSLLQKSKSKLDNLVGALSSYKEKKNTSPAAKKITDNEEDKAARIRYLKRSKELTEHFIDSVISGTHIESAEKLKDALDYKAFIRTDPYMRSAGAQMEAQIFDDENTD